MKIKPKQISTAATQTQLLDVNDSKEVGGDLSEMLKDTIYTDSIKYNDLTTVYYTISKDTVNVGLKILKRLFTLDFKKVHKYKYKIVNTNDLL